MSIMVNKMAYKKQSNADFNYYTLWFLLENARLLLPQSQIFVIPACPESFRKDSRPAYRLPAGRQGQAGALCLSALGRIRRGERE